MAEVNVFSFMIVRGDGLRTSPHAASGGVSVNTQPHFSAHKQMMIFCWLLSWFIFVSRHVNVIWDKRFSGPWNKDLEAWAQPVQWPEAISNEKLWKEFMSHNNLFHTQLYMYSESDKYFSHTKYRRLHFKVNERWEAEGRNERLVTQFSKYKW